MAIFTAKTKYGIVRGLPAGDHKVSVFKGIPYAAPPVGDLRWKEPQPPEPWEGELTAYVYSKVPCQPIRPAHSYYKREFFPVDLECSEDCLYMNIWTPAKSPDEKLPVAFWIYGGAYTSGYANKIEFDGEAYAQRGCVFVNFNYRVGAMGFFAHPELTAESPNKTSGNYGILDQIAALKWVQENIAAFGGDPEKVTIFGQSAGAMSCMVHCNSPLTDGLFHRAIMESCGGMNPSMYKLNEPTLADAEKMGVDILAAMGVSSVAEARKLPADVVTNQMLAAKIPEDSYMKHYSGLRFCPNIDRYVSLEGATESFYNNHHKKIDYMVGSTSNEGWGFYDQTPYDPVTFREKAEAVYGEKTEEYLKLVGFDPASSVPPCDMFSEHMLIGGLAWNELELARDGQTSYQYYFTKTIEGDEAGPFHSAEHAYLFQTLNRFRRNYDGKDYELSKLMCDYWANFIKTGDPNGVGMPRWEKYGKQENKLMELGNSIGMIPVPDLPGVAHGVPFTLALVKSAVGE